MLLEYQPLFLSVDNIPFVLCRFTWLWDVWKQNFEYIWIKEDI